MHRTSVLKESAPPRPPHERHRPENTHLYRIIDRHYPEFSAYMAEQGRSIPLPVQKEFDEYLKCDRLEPRVNLTRFHGVFAPNSKRRTLITPARHGKSLPEENKTPDEKRRPMTWAQRLKRVFNIDVKNCAHCGGTVKVIACIKDQLVIDKILSHLKKNDRLPSPLDALPETRAPPQASLFG